MIKKIEAISLLGLMASCLFAVGFWGKKAPNNPNLMGTMKLSTQEKWGVEVDSIRLSASDYMLDFRYRVNDPNKAYPVFSRRIKPYLVDQATGTKLAVPTPPKVGPLRQTTLKPQVDKKYCIMFAKPGKFVKRGNKVSVVIGDFVAKDLVVQ